MDGRRARSASACSRTDGVCRRTRHARLALRRPGIDFAGRVDAAGVDADAGIQTAFGPWSTVGVFLAARCTEPVADAHVSSEVAAQALRDADLRKAIGVGIAGVHLGLGREARGEQKAAKQDWAHG